MPLKMTRKDDKKKPSYELYCNEAQRFVSTMRGTTQTSMWGYTMHAYVCLWMCPLQV